MHARAVDLELAPPQPSVARSLRLLPGQSAISVTIRFDDQDSGKPVGLTTVTLKPHHFRVVIQAGDELPQGTAPGRLAEAHASARQLCISQVSTRRVHSWQPRVCDGWDGAMGGTDAAPCPPPDPGRSAAPR